MTGCYGQLTDVTVGKLASLQSVTGDQLYFPRVQQEDHTFSLMSDEGGGEPGLTPITSAHVTATSHLPTLICC